MSRYCEIVLVLTALVSGTGFRLLMNAKQVNNQTSLDETRLAVLDALSKSLDSDWSPGNGLGIAKVEFERFDPEAVVMMRPGADLQPGIAGVDDNANGIVDDASELGATRSDDVCLVERAGELVPDEDNASLVLQHGAFVPVSCSEVPNETLPWRAIVTGQSGDDHWSFLVEMD